MHPFSEEILDVASLDPLIAQYSDIKLSYFFWRGTSLTSQSLASSRVSRWLRKGEEVITI